jgi:hypothetical protein
VHVHEQEVCLTTLAVAAPRFVSFGRRASRRPAVDDDVDDETKPATSHPSFSLIPRPTRTMKLKALHAALQVSYVQIKPINPAHPKL